jgi:hypothetical protein
MHGGPPCEQCRSPVVWPKSAENEKLALAASMWRERSLGAMTEVGRMFDLSHPQTKGFVFHLTYVADERH